ncbi:MAG TPA: hypothetical protein VIQ00_14935 [Chitinophagaceae bacterium]|jgi:hypothetical protein
MKQAKNITRMMTLGLIILCTMGLSQTSFAGVKNTEPVELKYVGNVESRPVFQLNLNNEEADEYVVNIKDAGSNLIYTEKIKGANLSRTYKFDIEEADFKSQDFGLRFEVTSTKTRKTQVYEISSNTQVIENIVVAKL